MNMKRCQGAESTTGADLRPPAIAGAQPDVYTKPLCNNGCMATNLALDETLLNEALRASAADNGASRQ